MRRREVAEVLGDLHPWAPWRAHEAAAPREARNKTSLTRGGEPTLGDEGGRPASHCSGAGERAVGSRDIFDASPPSELHQDESGRHAKILGSEPRGEIPTPASPKRLRERLLRVSFGRHGVFRLIDECWTQWCAREPKLAHLARQAAFQRHVLGPKSHF